MEALLLLLLLLSAVVGLSLGLLGGGGSILLVPLLSYVAGMETRQAIATSLCVVAVTSLVSLIPHARHGNVRWVTGVMFGAAGMVGAFLGGLLGGRLPGTVLMLGFALMMLATAGAMLRGRVQREAGRTPRRPMLRMILDGLVVGLVTGLVGAGGGFLVVPALALLAGLPMPLAVGTSLLVIALKSVAGLAGYLSATTMDWSLTAAITAAAVAGSLLGARLSTRIPEQRLRRGFGYFVLALGVFVMAQELPHPFGLILAGAAVLAGVAVLLCTKIRSLSAPCPRPWARSPNPLSQSSD